MLSLFCVRTEKKYPANIHPFGPLDFSYYPDTLANTAHTDTYAHPRAQTLE